MSLPPMVGLHYRLCAYVCGKGCSKPSPFGDDTWATFTQIFNSRPDGCRFAIAQMVRMRRVPGTDEFASDEQPSGPFVVWDLFDEQLVRGKRADADGLLSPPPPKWMGEGEDGMIMKAMALYDSP